VNRALRAATMGVLLLMPVALTACGAGQVTQTASQNRDKTGGQANVGEIGLRDVQLAYPTGGSYPQDGDARLIVAIANGSDSDDTLLSISGDGFDSYSVVPGSDAGSAPEGDSTEIPIPANSNVYVGDGTGPTVTLSGLTETLTPAQALDVTFTFEQAGEVTVPALVGTSSRDLPRGDAFDFEEEGGEEG
jgi:copper(I)-binding protein